MDSSGSREPGTPQRRAWTQGPWHGDPADQARSRGTRQEETGYEGTWNPGAGDGAFLGDWTVATAAARTLARRVLRFLLLSALAGFAVGAGLVALAVAVWPHSVLAVLLVLLAVPVLALAMGMAAAVWVGRRAWRSGAWLEAAPMAAGMPWLSRVIWALRAALAGKALWRLRHLGRRPRHQPRAGDLSGTTR